MGSERQPTHEMPGGEREKPKEDGVVNDSLGTVDPADATGTEEDEEAGNAKRDNSAKRKTERNSAAGR